MILTDNGKILMSPDGKVYKGGSGGSKLYKHNIKIYQYGAYLYYSYIDNNSAQYTGNVTGLLNKFGKENSTGTYSFKILNCDFFFDSGNATTVSNPILSYQKRYDAENYSWFVVGNSYDGETFGNLRKQMLFDNPDEYQELTDTVEEM